MRDETIRLIENNIILGGLKSDSMLPREHDLVDQFNDLESDLGIKSKPEK
ncbi:hypothetical protein ACFL7M_07920 [Thermodesulfobacteriota bacterium]